MNYSTFIPVPEIEFNQLQQAANQVNDLNGRPAVQVSISRILPARGNGPSMVEAKILYKDLFMFWHLAKQYGIILQKVNNS